MIVETENEAKALAMKPSSLDPGPNFRFAFQKVSPPVGSVGSVASVGSTGVTPSCRQIDLT
jgi:hypothetical protein